MAMHTAERASTPKGPVVTAGDVKISDLDNNSLIIRLHYTINHLSRWLTPIHDRTKLERSLRRGEPTVKELLLRLRNEELRIFPMIHLIATQNNPDLDRLPEVNLTPAQIAHDEQTNALEVMAEFRR